MRYGKVRDVLCRKGKLEVVLSVNDEEVCRIGHVSRASFDDLVLAGMKKLLLGKEVVYACEKRVIKRLVSVSYGLKIKGSDEQYDSLRIT